MVDVAPLTGVVLGKAPPESLRSADDQDRPIGH